jgi:hypothetical protein
MNRDGSVREVTGQDMDDRSSISGRGRNLYFAAMSRQTLRPTKPNIKCGVPVFLPSEKLGQSVKLTN